MSEDNKRSKRFVRSKENNHIKLTDRDFDVLRLVYEHRFINSDQIRAFIGGSSQKLTRRLNSLFHNGYLDRPKSQLELPGNNPMVYGLGNKDAEEIAKHFDMALPRVDWTDKNNKVKYLFLEHTLLISQISIVLQIACRENPDVEYISPERIINRRPDKNDGLGWTVNVRKGISGLQRDIKFQVFPDNVFGLRYEKDGNKRLAFYFVEADRATMPIKRGNFYRSSFYKKMLCYWDSWSQDLFSKTFGFQRARVMTITSSPERIESLIEANKALDPRGQGLRMFLFAPYKLLNLDKPENILKDYFLNGRGEVESLIS